MGKLTKEGWSVVRDDDVKKGCEVGYVVRQQKDSITGGTSEALEPPIIRQQCIVGRDGDKTITTVTTRTVITSTRVDKTNYPSSGVGEDSYDIPDFARSSNTDDILFIEFDSNDQTIEKNKGKSKSSIKEKMSEEGKEIDETLLNEVDDESKKSKEKTMNIFSGIFKSPKLKKGKSKKSKEQS